MCVLFANHASFKLPSFTFKLLLSCPTCPLSARDAAYYTLLTSLIIYARMCITGRQLSGLCTAGPLALFMWIPLVSYYLYGYLL